MLWLCHTTSSALHTRKLFFLATLHWNTKTAKGTIERRRRRSSCSRFYTLQRLPGCHTLCTAASALALYVAELRICRWVVGGLNSRRQMMMARREWWRWREGRQRRQRRGWRLYGRRAQQRISARAPEMRRMKWLCEVNRCVPSWDVWVALWVCIEVRAIPNYTQLYAIYAYSCTTQHGSDSYQAYCIWLAEFQGASYKWLPRSYRKPLFTKSHRQAQAITSNRPSHYIIHINRTKINSLSLLLREDFIPW